MAFNYVFSDNPIPVQAADLRDTLARRLDNRNKNWLVRIVGHHQGHVTHTGPWRRPKEAPGYFAGTIFGGAVGDMFAVRGKLRRLFTVTVAPPGLPEKNTTTIPGTFGSVYDLRAANSRVARIARVAQAHDTGTHCNGLSFTRKVEGTNIWSQHSVFFDGCNAIDLTWPVAPPTGNDLPRQRLMVQFLLENATELKIHKLISEETEWEAPDFHPAFYDGVPHVSHTHAECEPYHPEIPHGV